MSSRGNFRGTFRSTFCSKSTSLLDVEFFYNAFNFDVNKKYVKEIWGSHRYVDKILIYVECYFVPTGT
jgi:hypothetical protein